MKQIVLCIGIVFGSAIYAQKEIAFTDQQRKEIDHASGSAFMQYSNFQPRTFEEVFMTLGGNSKMDSILKAADIDTLHQSAVRIFSMYKRKQFGLESIHSPTTSLFYAYGMYAPSVIKSFMIIAYARYLRKLPIPIWKVRNKALKRKHKENHKAKLRLKKEMRHYRKSY